MLYRTVFLPTPPHRDTQKWLRDLARRPERMGHPWPTLVPDSPIQTCAEGSRNYQVIIPLHLWQSI